VSGPLPDRFALQFDGVGDYASTGTAGFPTSTQAQTLSLWVNYTTGNDPQTFIVLRKFLTSGVQLGMRGGKLTAWRSSDGASLVDGPLLPAGTWHHVAYEYDGSSRHTLFLDGVQVATSATTPFDSHLNIEAMLGTFDGLKEMFKGQMDSVHVWGVARLASDLTAEMQGHLPAPPSGLIAWWGFDEDGGALAYDYTGHGNTCTLGDGDPTRMPTRVATTVPGAADAGRD
jgi:Concanavalin A-like lectin/glucanases superfamily